LGLGRRRSADEGLLVQSVRRFLKHRLAVFGVVVIVIMFLAAVFAPLLAPYAPDAINPVDRYLPPLSPDHLLGTDELGRDVYSRLLFAGRVSLTVGFAAMLVTILLGATIGV